MYAQTGFIKAISRLDATALVAGSMIGSGIFIVSAEMMRTVQSPGLLLLVWGMSGLVTLLGAMTYSELAAMFPHAGGQYVYLREGISPLFGYLYGWTLFLVIQTGTIAAVAVAFARFTSVFFPQLTPDVFIGTTIAFPQPIGPIAIGLSLQRLFAIISIIIITWINIRGVKTAALIQTAFTTIKVAILLGLIILGLGVGRNPEVLQLNFGEGFWPVSGLQVMIIPALGAAMVGSLFAMEAWNNVGFAAGEVKQPEQNLPFAMMTGTLIVIILYLLANVAYLSALSTDAIAHAPQDRVGTAAMQAIFGGTGLYIMAAAIIISTLGCNNGLILSGARVYYAMARDNLFFKSIGTLHPKFHTPAVALILQAIWTSILCLSGTYSQLLEYVVFAAVLFYVLTSISLFALRHRRRDQMRPVRVFAYPWTPALYLIFTTLICINLLYTRTTYSGLGLLIVLMGIPVYLAWQTRLNLQR